MEHLLALDCSGSACSVAARRDDQVQEIFLNQQRTHAKVLLGQIRDVLDRVGLAPQDLQALVWCHGPGSFTGLRIAAACAQGLSYALGIPAIGVSSLFALALRAPTSSQCRKIWVGCDAHMGEIYTATFQRSSRSPGIRYLEEDRLLSLSDCTLPTDADCYLGSGLSKLSDPPDPARSDIHCQIHAGDLLTLDRDYLTSMPICQGAEIEPVYLRSAKAWKKLGEQG